MGYAKTAIDTPIQMNDENKHPNAAPERHSPSVAEVIKHAAFKPDKNAVRMDRP